MKKTLLTIIAAVFTIALVSTAGAQVITPTGITEGKSSQLVIWLNDTTFDQSNAFDQTHLQVTNTSNSSSVTVHVQLWISEDGSGDPVTDPCVEFNFTDTLTPNDTHNIDFDDIVLNTNPCLATDGCGGSDVILDDFDGEDGFVTVTPVVSTTDRRAIAFNHLVGSVQYDSNIEASAKVNAMGREARSFVDSSLLPDGTVLDGVTGGYVLLQPEVLNLNFTAFDPFLSFSEKNVNMVNIIFADNYTGPFGDYRSQPAAATFTPLLFDENEVPVSCQIYTPTCVINQGINDPVHEQNFDLSGLPGEGEICDGNDTDIGWARLTVTGVDGLENVIGVTVFNDDENSGNDFAYGRWMVAEGAESFPAPATPTPSPSVTPTPSGSGASPSPTGGGGPGGGGGGSGCAIAGPVQAGTAFANMLIALLPGAAFALRRRFAK